MIDLFGKKKKKLQEQREAARDKKLTDSQVSLLIAATETADAANLVTKRLRARLEDREAEIEQTLSIMNDALIMCDLNGMIQAVNPAASTLFGITPPVEDGVFVGDYMMAKTKAKTAAELWGFLDGTVGSDLMCGISPNGGIFPIDVNHTRLDRSDGTAIMLLVVRDIRVHHEAKTYRSIFESSFDGILVVQNGHIVAANPATSHMFGYTSAEVMSKSISELLSEEQRGVPSTAVLRSGEKRDVVVTTSEIWWNGSPASLVTVRDLPHKQCADACGAKMICCYDEDYIITFANVQFSKRYDRSPRELVGHDIRELMTSDERNLFQMHVNGIVTDGDDQTIRIQRKGVEDVWTDSAHSLNGVIEYQRVGYSVKT